MNKPNTNKSNKDNILATMIAVFFAIILNNLINSMNLIPYNKYVDLRIYFIIYIPVYVISLNILKRRKK